jgi:hypothetical protein
MAVTRRGAAQRQQCAEVYELSELDSLSHYQIAKATGVHTNTVKRWLGNPAKYDPFLDDIALDRAFAGERSVYEALTIWEQQELVARLGRHRDRVSDHDWQAFIPEFANSVGVASEALVSRINRGTVEAA